jgi:aspartyl-tRNA(Asn)/glutamyl-tRNA(Gln) amidotransferase subunit C
MVLSAEDVKKIAHLVRLAIDEEAIGGYVKNLTDILGFVEQMNRIDTTEVTPMAHPQDTCQRLREDKVIETNQREHYQKIAPRTESALYLVPKVIE